MHRGFFQIQFLELASNHQDANAVLFIHESDGMALVLVVGMKSIHTLNAGVALFKELGRDLREHGISQNVLFLDGILGSFRLQLVHFGLQRIGKAAG